MTISAPQLHWPARDADERAMLEGYLESYRALAVRKVAGLDAEQLRTRLGPSTMTLGGLLKHLAVVEDDWFHGDVAGNEYPEPWASVDRAELMDWTWSSAANDSSEELLQLFEAACARSRGACAAVDSLDTLSVRPHRGERPNHRQHCRVGSRQHALLRDRYQTTRIRHTGPPHRGDLATQRGPGQTAPTTIGHRD